ncbi:T9SS type A sorting domain-containing protein [Kaistella faecalis]|uniref:T9SS type A sorting domain-containing protein n=1 Tax=Kaistella faecalis TaxID=2852098 RepID=UPI001C47D1EA|nr:T9SS type A sorting domain-containing protein [Chryseobacterium faecale]UFK97757.1 T9SS type A sorting domain-containing protein [Chryseobacterium faecale]
MTKFLLSAAVLAASFTLGQTYDNGGLSTGATSKSGVAAPAGYTWSELQNNTGNSAEANTSLGLGGTYSSATTSYFLADDFTVPADTQWNITRIDFFAYQTNYTGTASPFNTVRVNIFSSDPSVTGAVSVFGDDTTNRFLSSVDADMYRTGHSTIPVASTPSTNRKIWKVTANTPVSLPSGTYWMKYQLQNAVAANAGFLPPVTIAGTRGLPDFNAKQYNAIDGMWTSIIDSGNPTAAPDYSLDMPFVITFTTGNLGTDAVMQYDNRIKVYPNPVNDHFRISNPGKLAISSVEIMDAGGRTVKVLKSADEYQVSDLPKGNYLVKINSNESPKITKLIKL